MLSILTTDPQNMKLVVYLITKPVMELLTVPTDLMRTRKFVQVVIKSFSFFHSNILFLYEI